MNSQMLKKTMNSLPLWEILVPRQFNSGKPVSTRHHQEWDRKVIKLTGGLTIGSAVKGKWSNDESILFYDGNIPVRLMCSEEIIEEVALMTIEHYRQEAVMFYLVSSTARVVAASKEQISKFTLIERGEKV